MEHKVILPRSLRDFVGRQQTIPIERLIEDDGTPSYPYCEYWRRAVAAMLLSGRVAAKDNGFPNMTDVNRICKEANFDQYLFELLAPPELPAPTVDFKVLPNLCVFAGTDLPPEKLVPLFCHCKIKRIDRVFEFRLNKRQLTETVSQEPLGRKLREVLEESGPLPATVDSLLRNRPLGGGEIRIRGCSAIVQPESVEVLDAIRQHRRLKGYLEAGAPKGYLLIKQQSNPNSFVQRCKELGFKVTMLQG